MSIVKTLTPDNIGSTLEVKNQKLEVKNLPIVPYGSWETITKTDPAASAILIQTQTGELLKVPAAGSLFQFLSVSIHSTLPSTAVGEDRLVTITVQNASTTDVESATLNINLGYPYSADDHQPIYSASYNGSSSSTGSVSVESSQHEPTAGQFSYELGNIARGAIVRLVFQITLQMVVSHTISATVSINNPHISSSESSHRATLTLTASRNYTHEEPNLPNVECPLPLVTHVATGKTLRLARDSTVTTDLINGFSEDQLPVKIKLPARYSIRPEESSNVTSGIFNGTWGSPLSGISVSAELIDEAGMQIVTLSTKCSSLLTLLDTQQTNCQPVRLPIIIFERKAFDSSGALPDEVKTAIRDAGTMPVTLNRVQHTKITGQPPINSFFQEDFSDGYYNRNKPEEVIYSDNSVWVKSPQHDIILMPTTKSSQFLQDIQSGALNLDGLTLGALFDRIGGNVNDKARYFLNRESYSALNFTPYLGNRVLPRFFPDSAYEDTQSIISPYIEVASAWNTSDHFIAIKAGTPEGTYFTNSPYSPLVIKVVNQLPEYP